MFAYFAPCVAAGFKINILFLVSASVSTGDKPPSVVGADWVKPGEAALHLLQ